MEPSDTILEPLKVVMDQRTEEDFRKALNQIAYRNDAKLKEAESWRNLRHYKKHDHAIMYSDGLVWSWRIMMSVLTGEDHSETEVDLIFVKVHRSKQKWWQRLFNHWC